MRYSEVQVEAAQVVKDLRKQTFHLGDMMGEAIEESKRIPGPLKRILKDRLFYRVSRSY